MPVTIEACSLTEANGRYADPPTTKQSGYVTVVRCCWEEICDCGLEYEADPKTLESKNGNWKAEPADKLSGNFRVRVEASDGSVAVSSIFRQPGPHVKKPLVGVTLG